MWRRKFDEKQHCPTFWENESVNPVTKRKMMDGGPSHRWWRRACKRVRNPGNLAEFVAAQGQIGLNRLLDRIVAHEDGKYVRDIQHRFGRAFKGALQKEIPHFILDLGARKFKISNTGPMAKRLKTLSLRDPLDLSEIIPDEVEPKDFCGSRNIKALPRRGPFKPQPHQIRARDMMREPNSRMLLEHGLGSGKTCTSALVITAYLEENPHNLVYFFSPGGLRSNFMNEYCSFCPVDRRRGPQNKHFRNFRFFSLDDSSLKRKLPKQFKDCLVVVDEAQSLINSFRYVDSHPVNDDEDEDGNGGKNLVHLFQLLTNRFDNMKLLMLSGTPMPDSLDQHYNCISLLNPQEMAGISRVGFEELFSMNDGVYMPRSDLLPGLYGKVSYFKSHQEDVARSRFITETVTLPEENRLTTILKDLMEQEDHQRRFPLDALVKMIMKQGVPRKKAFQTALLLKTRASRRDRSCRVSNIHYPDPDDKELDHLDEETIDDFLEQNAPKLKRLVENLLSDEDEMACPGKQIIYCPFKKTHGVNLIGKILSIKGISNVVYSGDLSNTQREKILLRYNHPSNDQGDDVKVFIFTDAAAEGISLQSVRGVHLINESIYSSRMNQVVGRAIRYQSHNRLPQEDRNVTVYRYRLLVGAEGLSSDEQNYRKGLSREYALSEIQNLIHTQWAV